MVVNHGTLHLTIHQEKWGDAWAGKSTIEFDDFPITAWWFQTWLLFSISYMG